MEIAKGVELDPQDFRRLTGVQESKAVLAQLHLRLGNSLESIETYIPHTDEDSEERKALEELRDLILRVMHHDALAFERARVSERGEPPGIEERVKQILAHSQELPPSDEEIRRVSTDTLLGSMGRS